MKQTGKPASPYGNFDRQTGLCCGGVGFMEVNSSQASDHSSANSALAAELDSSGCGQPPATTSLQHDAGTGVSTRTGTDAITTTRPARVLNEDLPVNTATDSSSAASVLPRSPDALNVDVARDAIISEIEWAHMTAQQLIVALDTGQVTGPEASAIGSVFLFVSSFRC